MQPKFYVVISVIAAFLHQSAAYIEGPEREENSLIPEDLVPIQYALFFEVNMTDKKYFFYGTAVIRLKCKKPTKEIILNMSNLFLDKNEENGVNVVKEIPDSKSVPLNIFEPVLDEEKQWLYIGLEEDLQEEDTIQVQLDYHKFTHTSNNQDIAFVRYNYFRKINDKLRRVAVSIPGAVNARRLYPCIDNPALKKEVRMEVGHDEHLISLSNTWIRRSEVGNSKQFVTEPYDNTPLLSAFSIGFVVGDFVTKPKSDDSSWKRIKIWSDEDVIEQLNFARETVDKVVEFYKKLFGHGIYKVDVVALPFYGRTNKWNYGLIALEESLIINENPPTQVRKVEIAFTLCDIFCNQYFGPQVTFQTWSENWLNMGLALLYRTPCIMKMFPDEKTSIADIQLVESFIRVLSADAEIKSRPVMVPDSRIDLTNLFQDTILAETAHFLVRMMSYFLGTDVLSEKVKNLISEFGYKVTSLEDLWKTFSLGENNKLLPEEVTFTNIMDSWTLKEKFAHIKITRNKGGKFVTIEQVSPAFSDGINTRIIPLNFITSSDLTEISTTQREEKKKKTEANQKNIRRSITMKKANKEKVKYWLQSDPITISVETNDWIMLYSRLQVLCRVEYDQITLKLLKETLMNKKKYDMIDVMARTQFISDLFASAEMGKLSHVTLLKFMIYLKHEKSPLPMMVALHEFNRMRVALFGTKTFSLFQEYVQDILTTIIRKNKFNIRQISEDNYEQFYFQKLIFTSACAFQLKLCVQESVAYFKQLRKDKKLSSNTYPIPAVLRESFYCQAIKEGDENDWLFLIFYYTSERWDSLNDIILNAVACTADGLRITHYLDRILEPDRIAPRDRLTVFKSLASNEKGYKLMRTFLHNNANKILAMYGNDRSKMYPYLQILYENTWKQEDLNQLSALDAFNVPPEDVELHLTGSIQIAQKNILWLKNMEVEIFNFFKAKKIIHRVKKVLSSV